MFAGSALGGRVQGARFCASSKGYPDLHWTIEDTIAEEDKVVACWTISGTQGAKYLESQRRIRVPFDRITSTTYANEKSWIPTAIWDCSRHDAQLASFPPLTPKSLSAR